MKYSFVHVRGIRRKSTQGVQQGDGQVFCSQDILSLLAEIRYNTDRKLHQYYSTSR